MEGLSKWIQELGHLKVSFTDYCNASHFSVASLYGKVVYSSHPLSVEFLGNLDLDKLTHQYIPFAYVIIDSVEKEIQLVRDHLGIQPLYYYYQNELFIFSESIADIVKQLARVPPINVRVPPINVKELKKIFDERYLYSDETIYEGICRVEPGHVIHIKDKKIIKRCYWRLEQDVEELRYKQDEEYVEHFSSLMDESILVNTQSRSHLAAEFSAGFDSTAIYCALSKQGLKPDLYMHINHPDSEEINEHSVHEKSVMDYLKIENIHRIGGNDFDPLSVFEEYASWFAGPAPHLFYMFANTVHKAIRDGGHKIVLSGFGGDQGVSSHVPTNFICPQLIRERKFREALALMGGQNSLGKLKRYSRYLHPAIHKGHLLMSNALIQLRNIVKENEDKQSLINHPFFTFFFRSLREAEWQYLQGSLSYEIRMGIEYSSVVSKQFGFEYRYPLLYPKLLEFYLRVPYSQKFREGKGRYLMRRYLSRYLPEKIVEAYEKRKGLPLMPSTKFIFEKRYHNGSYRELFKELPYQSLINVNKSFKYKINLIHGYMLKCYLASRNNPD